MWSIGIYSGESPFNLKPHAGVRNPVLTADHVTDVAAAFVADPFMLRVEGAWYMFFEVLDRDTGRGVIAFATSPDIHEWTYGGVVLQETFHLSYPYVFEWQGSYFMVPETLGAGAIQLYRADSFPAGWRRVATLIDGAGADPSPFFYGGQWWMFLCSLPYKHDTLRLYRADELTGKWVEHPSSPIVRGNCSIARPAGRVLVLDGHVIRYAQDCYPVYGSKVRAFDVLRLNPDDYTEAAVGDGCILGPSGSGWNGRGMHHLDPHPEPDGNWIACVDAHSLD